MGLFNSKNSDDSETPRECCPPESESLPPYSAKRLGVTAELKGEIVILGDSSGNVLKFTDDNTHASTAEDDHVKCYIVNPPTCSKDGEESSESKTTTKDAIIVIHDIFGFDSARTHHMADELAEEGYVVLCPDLFGNTYDGMEDPSDLFSKPVVYTKTMWTRGRIPWEYVEKRLFNTVIEYMRNSLEIDGPIGLLGFCWGGWANFKASTSGKICCAAGAHPSPHLEKIQCRSIETLVNEVKCPQLLLPAWIDPKDLRPDGYMVKKFKENFGKERSDSHAYLDQKHGFCNRGDLKNESVKAAYEDSMRRIKAFFLYNMRTDPFVPKIDKQ